MKNNTFILLVLSCVLLSSIHLFAQAEIVAANKVGLIKEMMDKYNKLDMFSGTLLVAEDGIVKYKDAFMYADRQKKIPNTVETEYDLASVVKLFTVTAIFQLFDLGKLSMNDKVGKYLEGFSKEISEKVTVSHLLSMKSGLGNYMDLEFTNNPKAFETIKDRLNLIKKQNSKLFFEPGTSTRYSNSGYVLLGGIIEKISGMDYFTYIKENILKPLKMSHTNFFNFDEGLDRAIGYDRDLYGVYSKSTFKVLPSSDGNGSSNVNDLLTFTLKFCNSNDLVSDRAKIMYFTTFDSTYTGDYYSLKSNSKIRKFGWVGGLYGISTVVRHSINNNISIIVLSNYNNEDVSKEIADRIEEILSTGSYSDVNVPISEIILATYNKEGINSVKTKYADQNYEANLNDIGYFLLRKNKLSDAIIIFQSVVELFPQSANAYDSLAEAYMISGDKELAIKNYEKSLELNPQNTNAVEQLKKLKTK